jgi:hypothetical protein
VADAVAAALDHQNADVRWVPAGESAPASLPPVFGANPDVTIAQIFNTANGPLPLSSPLTTHGGTLAIFVSGTGTVANFNPAYFYITGVFVTIDGNYVGQATIWVDSPNKVSFSNVIIAPSIEHGDHTIAIENFKNNIAPSEWDLFNLTVLEL